MTRYFAYAALLLITLCSASEAFCAQVYDNKLIERIDVVFVNESADSAYHVKNVLAKIRTRSGDVFSQSAFDHDLKDLANDYDHVEPSIEMLDTNLYITLKIWPKPIIRSICWEGNCKVTTSTLCGELGIKSGALFDRVDFNRALHKLKAYYIKQGFFEAEIDFDVIKDPDCNDVNILIRVCEGRSGRIKKINFCGFSRCEEDELAALMFTKEYRWWLSWYTNDGTYNEEAIQIDQFRILNFLHDKGYADATVDVDICEAKESNRIIINISANKGEQYFLGPVTFCGNTIFSDEDIAEVICIGEGSVYSPEDIRDCIRRLTDLYGRYGYIDAVVDYEAKLTEGQCAYALKLLIEEGDQFRVGLIRVFGNWRTQSRVLMHECLLIPGEVFNTEKLRKSEERLLNIGFFKCVNVYIAQVNEMLGVDCKYRDVHIEVEETGTGNFGAFGGYSTAEDLFCGINISEKNFDHKGFWNYWDKGLCAFRGAGEYLSLNSNIGQKATSYGFSWTQPFYKDTPWSIGLDADRSWNCYISNQYEIRSYGFALHASYPLDKFTRFGTHYRLRNSHVILDQKILVDKDGKLTENAQYLQAQANLSGLISAAGVSLIYDSTDSPACPTDGFRSKLQLEYAGLGGDHHFWSFAYVNTFYYALHKKGVLKLRADARYLMPSYRTAKDQIPIDERLFLGGDNQIRGYRPYAIGPKFPNSGDTPAGGISLTLFSVEYNHKIFDKLDAFLFFDAGELTATRLFVGDLNYSAGYGIRLKVFEGAPPVCLGMGYPLNAASRGDIKRFFWTLGGRF